ncbi:MAG: tRNA (adenosine(37)-N6)-threonylcarbamoyltransferase complex ATPase subunit type 1 TsaE [Flavobacteriaceae bacterium]|nr:tRNA (adenosine(37)-N6)-threonylcarbamoyltransferase complex ATPase subunit type 1 TsaE [Flavobacteriaceae bacterium]
MTIQYSLDKIEEAAQKLIASCNTKILLFQGPMGSGKTTLIAAILKVLGCDSKASSPSFSIVNEYPLEDDIVYHFDFYRIKNQREALDIGVEEYFFSGHWNLIEWPEKIENLVPKHRTLVRLCVLSNNTRTLECTEI